jgi:integrase/recombinase XerD
VAGGKTRKRPIDILTPDDVRGLMGACSRRAATGVRDRALVAVLYATGLRISEALDLFPRDLDLDALTCVVQSGKGDRRRVVGVLSDAVDPVLRWLDRRRALGIGNQHVLFCTISRGAAGPFPTQPGGRLTREHVARVLKRLARRAGILKRVHPHGFRHAHSVLLRAKGLDVYALQNQLGHEHLDTTAKYCHRLGSNELPDRMRAIGSVLEPANATRVGLSNLLARLSDREAEQLVGLLKRAGT